MKPHQKYTILTSNIHSFLHSQYNTITNKMFEAKCQRGYSGTILRLYGNHTTDTA